jgi:hypothetical protein
MATITGQRQTYDYDGKMFLKQQKNLSEMFLMLSS